MKRVQRQGKRLRELSRRQRMSDEYLLGRNCKRLTQETVSKIPQTVRPRVALQLDLKTAYLAGCQKVAHQLVRG